MSDLPQLSPPRLVAWGDSYGLSTSAAPRIPPTPPSLDEQRAELFVQHPPPREHWIPDNERDPAHAMLNDGQERDSYFVYLPKTTHEFRGDVSGSDPINGKLHIMELPVGASCYKGIQSETGVIVSCVDVNRPDESDCRHCKSYAWYSDYITALCYSSHVNPRMQTYCFKATQSIRLVNLMDKRNLDLIVGWLERNYRSSGERANPRPAPYESLTEEQLYEHMKSSYGEQLIAIARATGYALSDETVAILRERGFRGYYPIDVDRDRPEPLPEGVSEIEEEFGDQYALLRVSREFTDIPLMRALRAVNERLGLGLHGYYAPTYKHFNREIALFQSKGLLRHDQGDPRNGCMMQAPARGGRRRTRQTKKRCRRHRRQTRVA